MRKKITFCMCLLLLHVHVLPAQSYQWATQKGLSLAMSGNRVCVDSEKNVIVMSDYGGGFYASKNKGAALIKYDKNGQLLWINSVQGSVIFNNVSLDRYDNIYVSGNYWADTIDFKAIKLYPPDPGHPERDVFIAKYDKNGTCLWVKNSGTAQSGYFKVVSDREGNLYGCAMVTRNNMNLTGQCLIEGRGNLEVFKIDVSGNCVWRNSIKVTSIEPDYTTIDKLGNFYIIGKTYFQAAFDTFTIPEKVEFIAKYNNTGKCDWVKPFKWMGYIGLVSCVVDETQNVYVAGFADAFTFEGKNYYSYAATNVQNSRADILVAKFDEKGNTKWLKQYGRKELDVAADIAIDNVGNLFLTGYYDNSTTLGNTTLTSGLRSPYVMKLDSSGEVMWVTEPSFPVGTGGALGYSVCNDRKGNVYVTGLFKGEIHFGNSAVNTPNHEMFLAKIADHGYIPTAVREQKSPQSPILYPNPGSGRFRIEVPGADFRLQDVTVRNVMGAEVLRMSSSGFSAAADIDISDKPRGIYFVEVAGREGRVTMKIVLQ